MLTVFPVHSGCCSVLHRAHSLETVLCLGLGALPSTNLRRLGREDLRHVVQEHVHRSPVLAAYHQRMYLTLPSLRHAGTTLTQTLSNRPNSLGRYDMPLKRAKRRTDCCAQRVLFLDTDPHLGFIRYDHRADKVVEELWMVRQHVRSFQFSHL